MPAFSFVPALRARAFSAPAFRLSCLAYLGSALPSASLGLLWPAMRISFRQPVGALGLVLPIGISAGVVASTLAGRLLRRAGAGPVVAAGTLLTGLALGEEACASSLWVFTAGTVVFGLGAGALDAALNAHAARCFGPRQATWMHAGYGLGACLGPLLVTALLGAGVGWRWIYGSMAVAQAALALLFALRRRAWDAGEAGQQASQRAPVVRATPVRNPVPSRAFIGASLAFAAAESGIESAAGLWGYVFLTAGRGLAPALAGLAMSGYWATMFAGRAVLGPVAERLGAGRVLAGAAVTVPLAAALMAVPGPAQVAAAGLMVLGVAAAPVFPLLTLVTADRAGAATTGTVSLQVAASAAGSAALPAGLGLVVGVAGAGVLGPLLLGLGLATCAMAGPLRAR